MALCAALGSNPLVCSATWPHSRAHIIINTYFLTYCLHHGAFMNKELQFVTHLLFQVQFSVEIIRVPYSKESDYELSEPPGVRTTKHAQLTSLWKFPRISGQVKLVSISRNFCSSTVAYLRVCV